MPHAETLPLAHRAQENVLWFAKKHMRQVSRLNATGKRVNMMTAENWLVRDELVQIYKTLFDRHLAPRHLSYADGMGGDGEMLQEAAHFFNRVFDARVPVEPGHIVLGAGCSSLLESLLYDICEPGEGVLIETPFWGGFDTSFVLRSKVQAVHVTVPLDSLVDAPLDTLISAYISAYQRAIDTAKCKIRAILICNPHNPRGHIYPVEVIHALLQFAQRNGLFYISDEIYALSMIQGKESTPFTSVLSVDLPALGVDLARVSTLYSISKDLGSSGLRLGFSITQAHPELRLSLAISNHSRVSTFTSLVMAALFRDTETLDRVLEQNQAALQRTSRIIVDFLTYHRIPFVPPAAGVYIWANLGFNRAIETWGDEARLNDQLEAAQVSVGAGHGYSAPEPGWFRITFALPVEELLEGLHCIETALGVDKRWECSV